MNMPFGKHRGRPLEQNPKSYLHWVLQNCENASPALLAEIRNVLGFRSEAKATSISTNVVGAWYRRLAMEFHPDHGGTHDGMKAVNRARELLQEMVTA